MGEGRKKEAGAACSRGVHFSVDIPAAIAAAPCATGRGFLLLGMFGDIAGRRFRLFGAGGKFGREQGVDKVGNIAAVLM